MTTERDIVERLRKNCNGHPYAKVAWPHYILHEAADTIEALRAERDALAAEANFIIESIPGYVRVREGGGPENLAASLALSVAKLRSSLATRLAAAEKVVEAGKTCVYQWDKDAAGEIEFGFVEELRDSITAYHAAKK